MPISVEKTNIDGVLLVKPHLFFDERGLYKKYYEKEQLREQGISVDFTEASDLYSTKGVLRGLHYQEEYSQAKLIHIIQGAIYDVAVDLRPGSKTFGKHYGALLDSKTQESIFIPEGFAHGFISLTEQTIFSYMCSGKYCPEYCGGIVWDDEELAIRWPLKEYGISKVICTEKDKNWPTFREYCEQRGIK